MMKKILSKYGVKNTGKIGKVTWEKGDYRYITFYSGDLLDDKPHGKGICEQYLFEKNISKKYKESRFNSFWKKYSKHFIHKSQGYFLCMRYTGEWKLGKREGHCEYTMFSDPYSEYSDKDVNADGSPIISNKKIGNFKNNKEEGKFKIFDNLMGWASINYKNGKIINTPVNIKKKINPNTNKSHTDYILDWEPDSSLWTALGDDHF